MRMKYPAALLAAVMMGSFSLPAAQEDDSKTFLKALSLYEKGLYTQARAIFDSIDDDPQAKGYAVLCAAKTKAPGYEDAVGEYIAGSPYTGLVPKICYQNALNLFDDQRYDEALMFFKYAGLRNMEKSDRAEYIFKSAYCDFEMGEYDSALEGFSKVDKLPLNDFSAPSRYASGYIWYERQDFDKALGWFELSVSDPRFTDISNYYIMECHFMKKNYDYVTAHGAEVYDSVPEERRPHLARLISEAYLVKGDAESAKKYFDVVVGDNRAMSRGDLFYAGSLLYTIKDYQGAVDNFSAMPDRVDSVGQVANYQLGFSYIQTKNKVAALKAFKDASQYDYRPDIQEDAFFNYAKLAFDLNNDPSVFDAYIAKYSDKAKGAQIYGYQAVSALYRHDYAGAVEAYDKIDELDPGMVNNYMKANYLRANQLVRSGSFRSAVPCLRAAAYYSDRHSGFNQLSRYWLAEAYYRDGRFADARDIYTDLYNNSALDRMSEGRLLPYSIAYCHFKEGRFDQSAKWFDIYLRGRDISVRKDALTRKADGFFITKNYKEAVNAYNAVLAEYPELSDLYPYYQGALAYGLTDNNKGRIELLSKVTEASPDVPFWSESIYELGRAYTTAKQDEKAAECYTLLLSGAKDSSYIAQALIGLGLTARNAADYDKAIGYYKRVVESMPSTEYADAALLALESIYQSKREPETFLAYIDGLGRSSERSDADREKMIFNAAEQIFLAENYQKALASLQAYETAYPQGANINDAYFYIAESFRNLDRKDQACDYYKKVIAAGQGSFAEASAANYARLSYGMERYGDAYDGYETLAGIARLDANKHTAAVGMMRSAYYGKEYAKAISGAEAVLADSVTTAEERREAEYIEAKSLMATSQRDRALELFAKLAQSPSSAEGAEAAYLVILDAYDRGEFTEVENKVFALSDAGTGQLYWLAKSFIVLGDSYVERDDYRQARATFESVRDGYTPRGESDDVLDNVKMRLDKLAELGQ